MVLKSDQARGRWGEETLRRVVEAAGIIVVRFHRADARVRRESSGPGCATARRPSHHRGLESAGLGFSGRSGRGRAGEARGVLASHAAKLKTTIKGLAERDYPRLFPNALDYVVLFVPAESLFSAALEGDHDDRVGGGEADFAGDARIAHCVTAFGERELAAARADGERAEDRRGGAGILFTRGKIHRTFRENPMGLDRANSAFNDAAASFESRVHPSGEKLTKLGGARFRKELADVQPLDSTLRLPPG